MGWIRSKRHKRLGQPVYRAILAVIFGATLAVPATAAAADSPWHCRGDADGNWTCEGSGTPASPVLTDTPAVAPAPSAPDPPAAPTVVPADAPTTASPLTTSAAPTTAEDDDEPRVTLARQLDWVPLNELDETELSRIGKNCCGAYIEPQRTYADAGQDPDTSALRVSADSTEGHGSTALLEGDVQVSQGYRQVRSDRATIDQQERTVQLDGNIIFREPGVLVVGDRAHANMASGHVDVDSAEFLLHQSGVRGTARTLKKRSENLIYIENATYTTCEPTSNAWQLKAADIAIDTARGTATAKHVRMEIADKPVLYLPWIRFPISDNRTTGLLYPVIMMGNDNGADISAPIYLNLAPNYDATLTPRLVQERGAMVEAEFRYLNRWSHTRLSAGYLHHDKGGNVSRETTRQGYRPHYRGDNRWLTQVDHHGGYGKPWSTLIDYTDVSDPDYFRDLGTSTLQANSQSHLNQQLATAYYTDNWLFRLQVQQFETLIKGGLEQYKQMPRFDANADYRFAGDLVLNLRQHIVAFDHTNANVIGTGTALTRDNANTTITGNRLRADYALSWDKQWLWGFFKPSAKIKHASYDLDRPLMNHRDNSPSVTVPVASIDAGLYFEQRENWLANHIHTLEPRVFYLHSSYRDQSAIPNFDTSDLTFSYQQLFRDDRFSGNDRIGDTEQVTLGLTTRLINATNGIERLRLSVGQVRYLKDRQVTLNPLFAEELTKDSSDIAAELGANLFNHWRLQADLLYDENDSTISKGSAALRYNNREDTLFNLVYRYTRRDHFIYQFAPDLPVADAIRSDIDQIDLSLALPIADNWRLLARYNHDLKTGQELEVFAGLEYSSCCWRASLVARRWVERDDTFYVSARHLDHRNGLFFQVQFRGLAGTGTRVTSILSEGIYGYQPPEF